MPAAVRVLDPTPQGTHRTGGRRPEAVACFGGSLAAPTVVGAQGCTVWDVAGRAYLDFHTDDGAAILGHADPDVAAATAAPGRHAVREATEALVGLLGYADAALLANSETAGMLAALRIARDHTGRERVLAGSSRPVPGARAAFSDLASLEALLDTYAGEVAAVVLEPMGPAPMAPVQVAAVRDLARRHGALLVFDETRAGLRAHRSGARGVQGIAPDLAVFGRSIGNGAKIAALAGPAALLAVHPLPSAEPDAAAAAAAAATLKKIDAADVAAMLRIRGAEVQAEVESLIAAVGAQELVGVSGDPTWSALHFAAPAEAYRARFLSEAYARGLYTNGGHAMSLAHGDAAVSALIRVYAEVFPRLACVRATLGA
jgi:glutamate-1-semialdehyde 2,1-aminomutase